MHVNEKIPEAFAISNQTLCAKYKPASSICLPPKGYLKSCFNALICAWNLILCKIPPSLDQKEFCILLWKPNKSNFHNPINIMLISANVIAQISTLYFTDFFPQFKYQNNKTFIPRTTTNTIQSSLEPVTSENQRLHPPPNINIAFVIKSFFI